jgi:hypothetical protein
MGVSNMRRRKARTALTCATLVLLTLRFWPSPRSSRTLRFNQVSAPGHAGLCGHPDAPTPTGTRSQQVAYRLLEDEFGNTRMVAPRGWSSGRQPGEQTFMTVKRADRQFDAKGLVGGGGFFRPRRRR